MRSATIKALTKQSKFSKPSGSDRNGWKAAFSGLFILIALTTGMAERVGAQTPAEVGQWEGPYDWPLVAVHTMMLPTGQVLTFDGPPVNGGGSARLWDPFTGAFTPVPNPTTDLFCVGQAPMADGRMFLAGGHFTNGVGLQEGNIYDPISRAWMLTPQMSFPRWYPTVTTLSDGRMLVMSGSQSCETCIAEIPEIYDPRTNTWSQLPGANLSLPLYPMMYVLPDGRILAAGTVREAIPTRVLDLATQTWTMVDPNVVDGHSSVMYRPGKLMKSGTAADVNVSTAPSARTTYVLDMTAPSPAWQATAEMNFPRAFHNLTMLPDGTVLATGGGQTRDGIDYSNAVLPAEFWNPATETWTSLAAMQTPRLYHSTALLLPDGRVLVSGSGRVGPEPQLSAEIYSPPYLFKGARPSVTSAPPAAAYGRTVFIGTPNASQIASVSLIGLGNVTHSFDSGQHFNTLSFTQTTGGLNVQMPANANLATPGYYMLFLVDSAGVPSVASTMLVGEDSDNDDLPDAWEFRFFGNLFQAASGDFDGDGLTQMQELTAGTSPVLADSDADGFTDGEELASGSNPLDGASTLPALSPLPSSMSFYGTVGGAPPPPHLLNINNSGPGTLNWTAATDQPWLAVSSGSGSTPGSLNVSVSTSGFSAGTYTGHIILTSAEAANSPRSVPVTLEMSSSGQITQIDFTYADRSALLADGWDFLSRTGNGGTRNTEQTTGLVVSYDQLGHPGSIRIPADHGDLWGATNDTRNTLFRDLPSDWNSLRMRIAAFAPTANYQAACLLAYQDDENYVALCRDFANGQVVEWWQESGGIPAVTGNLANSATTHILLRLDRDQATETLTAFVSTNDGADWTQLPGSTVQSLTGPRLGIFVGGNGSTSSFPEAGLEFVQIIRGPQVPTLDVSPSNLTFLATPGGPNPPQQTLNVNNIGPDVLSWSATVNQPWLTLGAVSGTAPSTISVNVSTAGLASGTYNAAITIASPEAANSPQTVPVVFVIQPPTLALTPSSLNFDWTQGTPDPATQTLTVSNTGGGNLTFTAGDDQPWLTFTPTSGTAPSSMSVSVSTAGLAPGTYNATISVISSQATNSPQTVPVQFVVSPPPPVLSAEPPSLDFSGFSGGANPASQTISVTNSGGGSLNYTAGDNQPWLSVSPASGSAPATLTVGVSIAGLAPGVYQGEVTITASGAAGSPKVIPITLTVTPQPSLAVSPANLGFTGMQGGVNPAAQAISVTDPGGGEMNWTAGSNQPWLLISPATGSAPSSITVTASTNGLAAGSYSGVITITAPGAINSPQTMGVTLTVTPPASLAVSSTALNLHGLQGGTTSTSESFSITNGGPGAMSWTAGANQTWISLSQTSGTAPNAVVVTASTGGLAPGTYHATITLTAPGATDSPRTIGVALIVDPAPPTLQINPVGLSFGGVEGGSTPGPQSVSVTNTTGGAIAWSATGNQPWLSVTPETGNTPQSISVSASTSGLTAGTYSGTVTVSAPDAVNSPITLPVKLTVAASSQIGHIDFTYADRAALLADGWSFVARTASGGSRNTEQTSGLIVDYDQAVHPGTLRIPTDQGTLWGSNNNGRNMLFRDLPAGWQSVRMRVAAYAPNNLYQSACILVYQDDDNYVTLCRDYVHAQLVEWWHEASGTPTVLGAVSNAANANMVLRIDRNPATNVFTGFFSSDNGANWMQLPGSVVKALANPRIGVFVGGNASGSVPVADVAYVEIAPTTIEVSPAGLNVAGSLGGPNPGSQTLIVTNAGIGSLDWTASANQPWVTLSPASGSAPGVITVNIATAGLAQGTYNATVTLTSPQAGNSPKEVPITLTVALPMLTTGPSSIAFNAVLDDPNPSPAVVSINNPSGSGLAWTATVDQPWLLVGPTSGTTPGSLTVAAHIAGLGAGLYEGTVTLESPDAVNSPQVIPVSLQIGQATRFNFSHTDRSALLADGWDFAARTASGGSRNTEQTSGLVVNYDQTAHPGTIRIPTDLGTLWAGHNNTRNTLFRNLDPGWESIRLRVPAYAPTGNYQSACLLFYQDDDNYVSLCRNYSGAQLFEWTHETSANPAILARLASTATTSVVLRFDRDRATNTITAFVSDNGGGTWTALPGSIVKLLSNPRVGIFVGGNASGSVPVADIALVDVLSAPPRLVLSPAALAFNGVSGSGSPAASQYVSLSNSGVGAINWSASSNEPWLTVSPSGNTPGALFVGVSSAGLAPGTYNGTVTITSSQATNSPRVVPVTFTINSLADHRLATVAVLINSGNPSGYNPDPLSPGEFQRYPERYLEHLQVPYELIDVSTVLPPIDFYDRQLIISGHRGLNLSPAWQEAITNAVRLGVGFVNLDWDPAIGLQSHIRTIFGTDDVRTGSPATTITVPAAVLPGGAAPHYVAGLQQRFLGDPAGDLVYQFHPDQFNALRPVQSTVLAGTPGVVIAKTGSDPFIVANSYAAGRAVHFGTLEYLKADRFGFLQGIDDLFWRSLVWAARKPFTLRGYPKLWSIQMDDTHPGWPFRVRDLFNSALTGPVNADGTGGPWKVTGYVYTDNLAPGSSDRASAISDINSGLLQIVPHDRDGFSCGDIYWNSTVGPLTDAQWLDILNIVQAWKQGQGGSDTIPGFSRSLVAHCWDLSNNTGYDLWNSLGFRYVTSIQRPGFQVRTTDDPNVNGGLERINARPFWIYEKPPKVTRDEDQPLFFADDYAVGSRAGLPPQTFFLFTTQVHGLGEARPDIIWPNNGTVTISGETVDPWTLDESLDQFKRHTWRLWSSMAPMEIFTHDALNFSLSSSAERQALVGNLSTWLTEKKVRHVFMEEMGDYVRARTKSVLTRTELAGGKVTYRFTGDAATAEGRRIDTNLLLFLADDDGNSIPVPGFTGGGLFTLPFPIP